MGKENEKFTVVCSSSLKTLNLVVWRCFADDGKEMYKNMKQSCLIKNNQGILLNLVDFALQEPEDNLMVAISRPWYIMAHNTMAAKPIKSTAIALSNDQIINNTLYLVSYILYLSCLGLPMNLQSGTD